MPMTSTPLQRSPSSIPPVVLNRPLRECVGRVDACSQYHHRISVDGKYSLDFEGYYQRRKQRRGTPRSPWGNASIPAPAQNVPRRATMKPKQVPVYHVIDGLKYCTGYTAENVRQALSYMPKDGDIVMVSYVKVGNNWLEQIIQLILYRGESATGTLDYHMRTPYPELVGTAWLEQMPSPRFMKTHFDYSRQPINPKARYVYLARNPLDVCVSFYHFTRSLEAYKFQDGSFDDFFEIFVNGETDWGDYLDHLASWYARREDDNVLFVTYEQLKKDFRTTVLKVARFLGSHYEDTLLNEPGVFQQLEEKSSIPFMTKLLEVDEKTASDTKLSRTIKCTAPCSDFCATRRAKYVA
ncbi:hypothetical protein HPB50_013303 [Hyalomma asiaticum]|uniref:Uncharacterized protein n=1 Tax=Hyalomma asiaticum TaxID=266040 RepID=A0ACB7S2W7_HYAAI|nr:hypothetical protein HPB50_013303 [Hyalomma asiaticum]